MESKFWDRAFELAYEAMDKGEMPVGCVFIYNEEIIAGGSNSVNKTKNATRHAEMNCVDVVLSYCQERQLSWKDVFSSISVYVTLEPCIMCASALQQLKVKEIFYGAANDRFGGCVSVLDTVFAGSSCPVVGGFRSEEAIEVLRNFYKGENPNAPIPKRKKKGNDSD